MKLTKQILIVIGCILLAGVTWLTAIKRETDVDRQLGFLNTAKEFLKDEVYIRAVEPLENAITINAAYTSEAEELLKDTYLHLSAEATYQKKYTDLLEKQMNRTGTAAFVYEEAAQFYFDCGRSGDAYEALRNGIEKTADAGLTELYESTRYAYTLGSRLFPFVSEICNGAALVQNIDGLWGAADRHGELVIPCAYEKLSTYDGELVILQDGTISAIDGNGFRLALCTAGAIDFGNLGESRIGLKLVDGWAVANEELKIAPARLDEIGMFQNGYAAAKQDGKWGLLSTDTVTWGLDATYDAIIMDELGRAYSQGTVFVRDGQQVKLMSTAAHIDEVFEDARPFADGWAAVKKNGKWGFIDTSGNLMIDYQFDDARSFSGHLAAVKVGELWGYVSLRGEIVIEPSFCDAKSFYKGSAPVKTEDGWRFLNLTEYK